MCQTAIERPHDARAPDDRMARADRAERERVRAMTPSQRLAEAIALSRTATRLASASKRPFPVDTRYGRIDVMQDEPGIPPYDELASRAMPVALDERQSAPADPDIDRVDLTRLEEIGN